MSELSMPVLDIRLQRTRKSLMRAMLELLQRKSFEQISIREVTASAGVGYATFYRHYAAKEGLLHELADSEVRALIAAAMPIIFQSNLYDSCRLVCARVLENRGLWRAMLTGDASGVMRDEFIFEVVKLKGRYQGFSDWIPEELQLICATGATLDILAWWIKQKPMLPADEVAGILTRVIDALGNPALA